MVREEFDEVREGETTNHSRLDLKDSGSLSLGRLVREESFEAVWKTDEEGKSAKRVRSFRSRRRSDSREAMI